MFSDDIPPSSTGIDIVTMSGSLHDKAQPDLMNFGTSPGFKPFLQNL